MWFWVRKVAEHGLFTAEETNRISNSGTVSWEGHGSDPIITRDLGPQGPRMAVYFSQSPYWRSLLGPSLLNLQSAWEPPPPDPGGQRASPRCLSVFTYRRLSIQIQQRAGYTLLGHRASVLPLIPSLCQSCMLIQLTTVTPPLRSLCMHTHSNTHFNLV